jgi:hypothetical protein
MNPIINIIPLNIRAEKPIAKLIITPTTKNPINPIIAIQK